ncbi:hypothetical protein [Streptomyces sp. NPDC058955]|uniref:hypothetical protein n=1 Tax=unclassified Streptomyces TaxID=2593676 RepID=UPI00366836C9
MTRLLNPTLEMAREALAQAFASQSELLVVHVTGHGVVAQNTGSLLVPLADTNEDPTSLLNVGELLPQAAQASSSRTVILIVDTAFAGAAIPQVPQKLEHWFVLAASDARGMAFDKPSLTAVLAQLFRGGVASCPYPMVTAADLAREAREILLKVHGGRQHVTWSGVQGASTLALAYNRWKDD